MNTFAEVVEIVDALSLDERESLVQIVQARMREERRAQLLQEIRDSREEFATGKVQSGSADQLMSQILK